MKSRAEYQRDYRARLSAGETCITIVLDEDDIAALIEARTLDGRQDHHTREALAAAVKAFLQISRVA